ncbi:hypothetical protein [Streptomyces albidus (ex Kaewkla and Franco 2022)]|uniref:hypothetical protein n=1 Tax=Streptomyces albidus (ex Kaewkla and Franco 2022) TaxID=722709 RepID=UPI0015EEF48D|nr:hypothetical protein [Streptomyces albidus (ex Kaewkla and Franco 2022)]
MIESMARPLAAVSAAGGSDDSRHDRGDKRADGQPQLPERVPGHPTRLAVA